MQTDLEAMGVRALGEVAGGGGWRGGDSAHDLAPRDPNPEGSC